MASRALEWGKFRKQRIFNCVCHLGLDRMVLDGVEKYGCARIA